MPDRLGVIISSPILFHVARDSALVRPLDVQHGLTAVVFAAASLEALINEVTELAELEVRLGDTGDHLPAFVEAMLETERSRGSIQLKFIVASMVLTGQPYERGLQPYQDFALLMDLRNAIMHLRPDGLVIGEHGDTKMDVRSVLKQLQVRSLIDLPGANEVTNLLAETSNPLVVRWAINAAARMAQSFLSMFADPFRCDVLIDQREEFLPIDVVVSYPPELNRPN